MDYPELSRISYSKMQMFRLPTQKAQKATQKATQKALFRHKEETEVEKSADS